MIPEDIEVGKYYLLKKIKEDTSVYRFPEEIVQDFNNPPIWIGKCIEKSMAWSLIRFDYLKSKGSIIIEGNNTSKKWWNIAKCVVREVDMNGEGKKILENLWLYGI